MVFSSSQTFLFDFRVCRLWWSESSYQSTDYNCYVCFIKTLLLVFGVGVTTWKLWSLFWESGNCNSTCRRRNNNEIKLFPPFSGLSFHSKDLKVLTIEKKNINLIFPSSSLIRVWTKHKLCKEVLNDYSKKQEPLM